MLIIRMTTVAKNAAPHPMALNRRRRLSSRILAEYSGLESINSEVIKRIIAVTASHKLISDIESGNIIDCHPQSLGLHKRRMWLGIALAR